MPGTPKAAPGTPRDAPGALGLEPIEDVLDAADVFAFEDMPAPSQDDDAFFFGGMGIDDGEQ